MATQDKGTSNRGFASMNKDKQREIAAQGGRASHGNDSTSSRGGGSSTGKSGSSSSTRGGSSDQHAKAGSQSHKNR